MECISLVSYSTIINVEPNGFFEPTRGIQQSDPLGPYIFILYMEAPNHFLSEVTLNYKFGIQINIYPKAMTIRYLFFADDCLLFRKTSEQSLSELTCILEHFSNISKQLINYPKSVLTFSHNALTTQKQRAMEILNALLRDCQHKYLGCPIFQGSPSSTTFEKIINHF